MQFSCQESRSGIGLIDVIYTAWLSAAPILKWERRKCGPAGARALLNSAYDALVVL